jgi:hypothetical protein
VAIRRPDADDLCRSGWFGIAHAAPSWPDLIRPKTRERRRDQCPPAVPSFPRTRESRKPTWETAPAMPVETTTKSPRHQGLASNTGTRPGALRRSFRHASWCFGVLVVQTLFAGNRFPLGEAVDLRRMLGSVDSCPGKAGTGTISRREGRNGSSPWFPAARPFLRAQWLVSTRCVNAVGSCPGVMER